MTQTAAGYRAACIMYAMGATQFTSGSQGIRGYAQIQTLLGNMGRCGGGINALRGLHNVQGSTDMGVLFDLIPGYQANPCEGQSYTAYSNALFGNRVVNQTATLTVDCANADADVKYTSKLAGHLGNAISVAYVDPGAPSSPLSIGVAVNAITVNLATDAGGVITSTSADVVAAVNGDASAFALVSAALVAGGTGVVEAKAAALEDAAVGLVHLVVGKIGRIAVNVKGVSILHDELAAAHQAEARADLVAELGLDLIEVDRQLAVGGDRAAHDVGHDLLVGRAEAELALVAVLDPQQLGPVLEPAAGLLPQLGGLDRRHDQLDRAGALHLDPDDRLELGQRAPREREVAVDAGGQLRDHAGTGHQALRDDLGVRRVLPQGVDEALVPAHGSLRQVSRVPRGSCPGPRRRPRPVQRSRPVDRLQQAVELRGQDRLVGPADDPVGFLAVLDDEEGGDGLNPVLDGSVPVGIDVELADDDTVLFFTMHHIVSDGWSVGVLLNEVIAGYQGETLNFETPGAFFGRLTERRWALVTALLGQGTLAVRELARRVGRDVPAKIAVRHPRPAVNGRG